MKFLVTADIHCRDYSRYNIVWQGPIPGRLLLYEILAQDLVSIAKLHDCSVLLIAGDILDIPQSSPLVLNYLKSFFSYFRNVIPVIYTHGQHDLSTRIVDGYVKKLTALSIFNGDNIYYVHDNYVLCTDYGVFVYDMSCDIAKTDKDVLIYSYGWSHEIPENLPPADMFMGHGLVIGGSTYRGREFSCGYNPEVLSNTYKFSVIGDIHNSQILYGNVLIPGPPIQNRFDDSPVTGVWVVDSDSWSCQFVPLVSEEYPKFLTVASESEIPKEKPSNFFYRVSLKTVSDRKVDINKSTYQTFDLWAAIESLIRRLKRDDHDELLSLAKSHYNNVVGKASSSRTFYEISPVKLSIRNFMSIKEYEFEFPSGIFGIFGPVGAGKTTLLEALCFCIYGVTTRGRYKDMIVPLTYSSGDPEVSFEFYSRGVLYKICRGLKSVAFFANGSDISKSRISETDKLIQDTIGMDYVDFSSLVYFSQEKGSFFQSLDSKRQVALLSLFLGPLEKEVDILCSDVLAAFKEYDAKVRGCQLSLGSLEDLRKEYERELGKVLHLKSDKEETQFELLVSSGFSDVSKHIAKLLIDGNLDQACREYFGCSLSELSDVYESLVKEHSSLESKKWLLEEDRKVKEQRVGNLKSEADRLLMKIRKLKEGVCPECGRPYQVDFSVLESLVAEYSECAREIDLLGSWVDVTYKSELESVSRELSNVASKLSELSYKRTLMSKFLSCRVVNGSVSVNQDSGLEIALSNVVAKIQSLREELDVNRKFVDQYKVLSSQVFHDRGLKSLCIEHVGELLSTCVNTLLSNSGISSCKASSGLSKDFLQVEINTVRYTRSGSLDVGFDVFGIFNGVRIPYEVASGGQKSLIDLSCMIAIYNLLSSAYCLTSGIFGCIILDESIRYMDDYHLEVVRSLLGMVCARTVLLVTHEERLKQFVRNGVEVSRVNGISLFTEIRN